MLLKHDVLDGIVRGDITRVYRKWKRPTVKTGGSLRTAVGVIEIDAVDQVTLKSITEVHATQAGYESRNELLAELKKREGKLYCIQVRYGGEDPRIQLRNERITNKVQMLEISTALTRMDEASKSGAWTIQYLELISENEGVLAETLAQSIGTEKKPFKARVRRLKELGLTESLKVGYRLSPRGKSFLSRYLRAQTHPDSVPSLGLPDDGLTPES